MALARLSRKQGDWARWLLWLAIILPALVGGCRVWRRPPVGEALPGARQLSLRGAEALQQEKWSDAETYFSEALKESGMDERAHWGYAETMWKKGDRVLATEHMEEAVRLSGSNPDLSVRLGQMQLDQGALDEAAKHAKSALDNNRRHPGAWALQGDVLVAWQQWDKALAAYHRALIYQPDFPAVQMAVAELYHRTKQPQRALATLDRLGDEHPLERMPVRVQWLRAESLASLGRTRDARQALVNAEQRVASSDQDTLVAIAWTRYRLGDMAECQTLLTQMEVVGVPTEQVNKLRRELETNATSIRNMAQQPGNGALR